MKKHILLTAGVDKSVTFVSQSLNRAFCHFFVSCVLSDPQCCLTGHAQTAHCGIGSLSPEWVRGEPAGTSVIRCLQTLSEGERHRTTAGQR